MEVFNSFILSGGILYFLLRPRNIFENIQMSKFYDVNKSNFLYTHVVVMTCILRKSRKRYRRIRDRIFQHLLRN